VTGEFVCVPSSENVIISPQKSVFPSTSALSLYPELSYLFFAVSISISSVAVGAFPCMCL